MAETKTEELVAILAVGKPELMIDLAYKWDVEIPKTFWGRVDYWLLTYYLALVAYNDTAMTKKKEKEEMVTRIDEGLDRLDGLIKGK